MQGEPTDEVEERRRAGCELQARLPRHGAEMQADLPRPRLVPRWLHEDLSRALGRRTTAEPDHGDVAGCVIGGGHVAGAPGLLVGAMLAIWWWVSGRRPRARRPGTTSAEDR